MMDFTLKIYKKLLEIAISEGFSFQTIQDFFFEPKEKVILLRHDVDANPKNSFLVAKLENEFNIRSTYYFKTKPVSYNQEIIKEIAKMGNEIGYHYEDLADAHGDYAAAIHSFENNLKSLRQIYPVKTICMDGNAWSRWNNLDLWKKYNYRQYGIIAEPYLDLDFNKVLYLTDTGRKWNAVRFSVWDKVESRFKYHDKSTFDVMKDIAANSLPDQMIINTHPQRWHDTFLPWTKELVMQNVKNVVKKWIVKRER